MSSPRTLLGTCPRASTRSTRAFVLGVMVSEAWAAGAGVARAEEAAQAAAGDASVGFIAFGFVTFFAFFVSVAFTGFIAPVPDFFAAAFTARLIAVAV